MPVGDLVVWFSFTTVPDRNNLIITKKQLEISNNFWGLMSSKISEDFPGEVVDCLKHFLRIFLLN